MLAMGLVGARGRGSGDHRARPSGEHFDRPHVASGVGDLGRSFQNLQLDEDGVPLFRQPTNLPFPSSIFYNMVFSMAQPSDALPTVRAGIERRLHHPRKQTLRTVFFRTSLGKRFRI